MWEWFLQAKSPAQAAIVAGVVSLIVSFITAAVTLRVANERAAIDKKIAKLKGAIDRGIADRRAELDLRLQTLRNEFDKERMSAEQRQTNRRPFLEKQLAICFEVTDSAARLATETDPEKWLAERMNFRRLHWGITSLIDNQTLEDHLIEFISVIPSGEVISSMLPMNALTVPAYNIAHAARDLMASNWDVDLPPLKGKK